MNIQELTAKTEEAAELLQLLANPHRLQILCTLLDGERSVTALCDCVDLSQSALSQHLAKLREANIVTTRRAAQSIFYSIADDRSARILNVLADIMCGPHSARRPRKSRC